MAEAMTYNSLVQDIKDYAERSDAPFVTQIPRFIMLAENRIANEAHGLGFVRFANGKFSSGNNTLQKPVRWRETASFYYTRDDGKLVFLKQRSYSFCRAFWPSQAVTDDPLYYADYGYEHLLIVPTPAAALNFEMSYYERPIPLDASNQTNWTTQYAPQLLLYGSLLEAQTFLKRPEKTAEFKALFDDALKAVANEAERRLQGDQTSFRTGIQ